MDLLNIAMVIVISATFSFSYYGQSDHILILNKWEYKMPTELLKKVA